MSEQRYATRGNSTPSDADAMLARLTEAERFVDELLKRVEARFAAFDERRARDSGDARELTIDLDDTDDDY